MCSAGCGTITDRSGRPGMRLRLLLLASLSSSHSVRGWRNIFCCFLGVAFSLTIAPSLRSQSIVGRVFDDSTGAMLAGVTVSLVDSSGRLRGSAISGSSGDFAFAPGPGFFQLRVDGIGADGFLSRQFEVIDGRRTEIDLRVMREAVRLETATVTADAQPFAPGPLRDFYERTRRGPGRYLTRAQIEENGLVNFTSLLRLMPGVRVVRLPVTGPLSLKARHFTVRVGTRGCPPLLYLDGINLGSIDDASHLGPDRILSPHDLEGIEVYKAAQVPGEFNASGDVCGVIVAWTRRAPTGQVGPDVGAPILWRGGAGVGLPGIDRSVFQLSFHPANPNGFALTTRIRVGEYTPSEFLGREQVDPLFGFSPGIRPLYGSLYVGKQGPFPIESMKRIAYTRLAVGFSFYGGEEVQQVIESDSVILIKPSVAPRIGFGGEWAVGVGLPWGPVRPWLELTAGTEYVSRAGLRVFRPTVLFGIELGRRGR